MSSEKPMRRACFPANPTALRTARVVFLNSLYAGIFEAEPIQAGEGRPATLLDFRYSLLYITPMHKKNKPAQAGQKLVPGFRGRVWIDGTDGTFLGHGRVVLLERIREYGSITKAAKAMEMSYRHAWDLVESMNRQAERPFVELATGGKGGGGARITEEGERAIQLFWKFSEDFQKFLKQEQGKLNTNAMLAKPSKKK
jgi:molybdate transport system regulatory protein